jgi:hypothetical protein
MGGCWPALAAQQVKITMTQPSGTTPQLPDLLDDLEPVPPRWGWWKRRCCRLRQRRRTGSVCVLRTVGTGITAVAVSQGSSFRYDAGRMAGSKEQPVGRKRRSELRLTVCVACQRPSWWALPGASRHPPSGPTAALGLRRRRLRTKAQHTGTKATQRTQRIHECG